jgi:GntR family transcriptional regulator/MocR family aminotransferase
MHAEAPASGNVAADLSGIAASLPSRIVDACKKPVNIQLRSARNDHLSRPRCVDTRRRSLCHKSWVPAVHVSLAQALWATFALVWNRMLLTLEGDGPLYAQVYAGLFKAITEGRLPVGKRLPGTRTLAQDLGVSRTVVLQAYAQLDSEGITASRPGYGTYVASAPRPGAAVAPRDIPVAVRTSEPAPSRSARLALAALPPPDPAATAPAAAGVIDLADAVTIQDERGRLQWRRALTETLGTRNAERPDVAGLPSLRRALADYLRDERGVLVDPDDLLIVSGIQQARDITARVLVEAGDVVGIEDPCYRGIRATFQAMGTRVIPCAVDRGGFDIARHAAALEGARLLYVMPSHQFPTSEVMDEPRRLALLAWAERSGSYVVEDDFESEHRLGARTVSPLHTLQSGGRVIYIGSFAREYFPFMRLAYVAVPPGLRPYFLAIKWLADRGSAASSQRVLARYIASGDFVRNLRRLAGVLAGHRQRLLDAVRRLLAGHAHVQGFGGGGNALLHVPGIPAAATAAFLQHALAEGVRVQSADVYYARRPGHLTLLLRYLDVPEAGIDEAVGRLARAIRGFPATMGPTARCG